MEVLNPIGLLIISLALFGIYFLLKKKPERYRDEVINFSPSSCGGTIKLKEVKDVSKAAR